MIKKSDYTIMLKNVSKKYKLYDNDQERLLGLFLNKKFPGKEKIANDNISFKIKRGESVAILGRNGAGKSTLLKMITGVVFPTSGQIKVNGKVSALLELTAGFDLEFTGRENIHLKANLMGLTKSEAEAIEPDVIDFAELEEYIDQPVRTYSSGMRARLGFAIHVSIKPEILVVDEALSVGDIAFQEKSRKKIKEIMELDHVTVLLVTHSMESAAAFCSRGIVLNRGKLSFDGEINDAIANYKKSLK